MSDTCRVDFLNPGKSEVLIIGTLNKMPYCIPCCVAISIAGVDLLIDEEMKVIIKSHYRSMAGTI